MLYVTALIAATAALVAWVGNFGVLGNIALYTLVLLSATYAAEVSTAMAKVRIWWNVMVVSAIFTIPQTVFALQLAAEGKTTAAWIDTLASTVVDAMLVTAVVRRRAVGTPLMRSYLPQMLAWSAAALSFNFLTWRPVADYGVLAPIYIWLGYIALPALLVPWRELSTPGWRDILLMATHTASMAAVSYKLGESLLALHVDEVQLGVVSTVIATLPDFIVGVLIRATFAAILGEEAGDREVVATMLAAAVHDQVTVPALILALDPTAAATYPHFFNIAVVLIKFTLLSKKTYWFLGVPGAIILLLLPPV